MKKLILLSVLMAANTYAMEDCKNMAIDAAKIMSKTINQDGRSKLIDVTTISDDSKQQVVDVSFDASIGGQSITYTVTVERKPENQKCVRVSKIELTGEE